MLPSVGRLAISSDGYFFYSLHNFDSVEIVFYLLKKRFLFPYVLALFFSFVLGTEIDFEYTDWFVFYNFLKSSN